MKKQIEFSEIAKQVYEVYGQQSVLPILFGVASIYREHIISVNHFFPILFLKGSFATGKTSLSSSLQIIFSKSNVVMFDPVKSSDIHAGVSEKGIVILDEYHSGNKADASIKAAYDNAEMKTVGRKMKIDSRKATAAVIVLSHELPKDVTVLSRAILVSNENAKYSETQIDNFNSLQETLRSNDCNCVSELAVRGEFLANHFETFFNRCKEDFLPFSESKNHRIIANYATVVTVFDCLKGLVNFPFDIEELYQVLDKTISEHDGFVNRC